MAEFCGNACVKMSLLRAQNLPLGSTYCVYLAHRSAVVKWYSSFSHVSWCIDVTLIAVADLLIAEWFKSAQSW